MNKSSNFDIKIAEEVIDEAIMNNKPHYLIKWKYLPHQFDTWESLENLQSVTGLLQKWIRTKRQSKQPNHFNSPNSYFNSPSSYFDTVNNIDPLKKIKRKRKPISKRKRTNLSRKEIVILDQDNESQTKSFLKNQSDHSFIDDDEEQQISEKDQSMNGALQKECDWNALAQQENGLMEENPDIIQPLKFDPEIEAENKVVEFEEKPKRGMKVVGRIKSEEIQVILERFKFRSEWCFKLELTDGRVTNMRQQDLKKLSPQLMMQFYEDNDIKV